MSQISEAPKTEIAASDISISNFAACCQSEESEEEPLLPDLLALRAEGDYQQNHDAADLCYAAMLNYRSLRMKEQANEAHQIEKGKNHTKTPGKATLVQNDSEDGDFQEFDSDSNDGLSGQDIARLFADQAGKAQNSKCCWIS